MRVLDTHTGRFVEIVPDKTNYAILSHTWDPDGEQTYQDVWRIQNSVLYRIESALVLACIHVWCGSLVALSFLLSAIHRYARPIFRPPYYALLSHINLDTGTDSWLPEEPRRRWRRWASGLRTKALETRRGHSMHFSYRLSAKVRWACAVARAGGYRYIWIDSCCIDKTSSSELSEAINSMYRWYECAACCYAFLADVPDLEAEDLVTLGSPFRHSNWFKRGWTLQELIAPSDVVFLSCGWNTLGSKFELADVLESITGIELAVLIHKMALDEVSVATRMSWAADRATTRVEDQAYSLFGIFGVNMSTLYGEGELAFRRLQMKILKQIPDQSIFAWSYAVQEPYVGPLPLQSSDETDPSYNGTSSISLRTYDDRISLLAHSPMLFRRSRRIRPIPYHGHNAMLSGLGLAFQDAILHYTSTPHGIRTGLPLLDIRACIPPGAFKYVAESDGRWYLAILACGSSDKAEEHLLARVCYVSSSPSDLELLRPGYMQVAHPWSKPVYSDLVMLSSLDIVRFHQHIDVKTVYVPHPIRAPASDCVKFEPTPPNVRLTPPRWAQALLKTQGYALAVDPCADEPNSCRLVVSKGGDLIHISCTGLKPFCLDGMRVRVEVETSALSPFDDAVPFASRDPPTCTDLVWLYNEERQKVFSDAILRSAVGKEIVVRTNLRRTSVSEIAVWVSVIDRCLSSSSS